MAEQVQAVLDRMVSPLKDLLDKGIFDEVGKVPSDFFVIRAYND